MVEKLNSKDALDRVTRSKDIMLMPPKVRDRFKALMNL
jgi:hypothetical protein